MSGRVQRIPSVRRLPVAGCLPPALGSTVTYHEGDADPETALAPQRLSEHLQRFGPCPSAAGVDGAALLRTIEEIGLTGRGGGHFPTAVKWRSHLNAGGGGTLVANGAESEPESVKDRALLQLRPHLILDGLQAVAELLAVEECVLWLHESSRTARATLEAALLQRRTAGLGEVLVRIVTGPDRYLSGESSALLRTLDGGPTLPTFRRNLAARATLSGAPALVHNVETLTRVALACRSGAESYRPSVLLSIAHDDRRTVVEADAESTLEGILVDVAGVRAAPQAVLLGGYGGRWHHWSDVARLPLHEPSLAELDVSLGAGVVIPVDARECGLAQVASIAGYLADSSARQCGPCVFGLRDVADVLADVVAARAGRRDVGRLRRFIAEISGRGGCNHPDGAVRMVSSAIEVFTDDLDSHLRAGSCRHDRAATPFVQLRARAS